MSPATMQQSTTPVVGFEVDTTSSTTDVFLATVTENPNRPLVAKPVEDDWEEVSAGEFLTQVRNAAKGLIASGVEVGDRIAIFGPTSYEWTLSDYTAWFAGAVSVPFYDTSSEAQLAWMIQDAGVGRGLVSSREHADRVEAAAAAAGVPAPQLWIWDQGAFSELEATGRQISDDALETQRQQVTGDSVATLIYTSGTTGRPKGCVLTHGNFVQTAQAAQMQIPDVFATGMRCLLFLPQAHVFARFIEVLSISSGALLAHQSDLTKLTDSLGSFRPSFILGVPRVFEKVYNSALAKAESGGQDKIFRRAEQVAVAYSKAMDAGKIPITLKLQHALFDKLVYSKLRSVMGNNVTHAVSGGGPLGAHLGHFFRGVGLIVLEGYGLTETTAPITVNVPDKAKIGTVGVPLPGVSVAIAPDGEILAKGAPVFHEYWNNPKATAKEFHDGWFATGDLGSLDEDGYLAINGRKKEIIVTSSGKNIAPAPLEDALRRHPLIGQPVVVGDNRKFVSALIFLDSEVLPTWLKNHHLPAMDLRQASTDETVRAAIEKAVESVNRTVSRAEGIKKFAILPVELTEDNGYLSAKQSVKRHVVNKDFAADIDELYAD
ncbi:MULTISPECIES: long-chain fatty acid--CoA ligase [Brevibacterium]|uniref:Acyl-CoA synthetase n=2 Tax=Brevibacterium antiquum TaxID=234835 RepID=A0A2H1HLY2_9MICO|nr:MULTISPECIES: AMP-dependent synthetase/ligase [Brevibacterium]SMX63932.1 long-chain acyl-CoA synthetase [Brevibacterium antiquum CNRZ 918]SMX64515.1 long-chain acyl-CoA synthetase [Brevibacterium antiquum]HCG57405.1 long-chain fatty acid--CoA ligase [Brevibacterium sp.]